LLSIDENLLCSFHILKPLDNFKPGAPRRPIPNKVSSGPDYQVKTHLVYYQLSPSDILLVQLFLKFNPPKREEEKAKIIEQST
jgi:hypothetical protein